MRRATHSGFTLIELLITMTIIGILAAIAYPMYGNYVQRTRRTDATIALTSAAQQLERLYTENNTYASAAFGTFYPARSPNGHYDLSFVAGTLTANSYTIQAVPAGAQATDACGTFTLDSAGNKGVTGGSLPVATCWGR